MKYQALFDLTMERGCATIRVKDYPESIVIPVKGYAVAVNPEHYAYVNYKGIAANTAFMFDSLIDEALEDARTYDIEYIGTFIDGDDIVIDLVNVFASKEYAMGYAHCSMQEAIYDLGRDQTITIKRKAK